MAAKDMEKNAFVTIDDIFFNTWMPFELKKGGAEFQ